MKRSVLTFLLSVFTSSLFANGIEIGGLYYLLDQETHSATLTYSSDTVTSSIYSNYSGEVTIPDTVVYEGEKYAVEAIGASAFQHCGAVTNVIMPKTVKRIEPYAFSGVGCRTFVIGEGVERIENNAFVGSGMITSITFPKTLTYIGAMAFHKCLFTAVDFPTGDQPLEIAKQAFYQCWMLKTVTLGDNVASVAHQSFGDTQLSSVTFPKGFRTYHSNAFYGCAGLQNFYVDEENPYFSSLDGVLCNKEQTAIVGFPNGRSELYEVPACIDSILSGAFYQRSQLKGVVLHDSIQYIGKSAFQNCTALSDTVTLPSRCATIGESAFQGCTALTHILIPEGVVDFGHYAFAGCPLQSLILPASIVYCQPMGMTVFLCNDLNTVYCLASTPPAWMYTGQYLRPFYFVNGEGRKVDTLFVPYESVDAYKASVWTGVFANIKPMPNGFSSVEDITTTSAVIKWIPDSLVVEYTIDIYTADTLFRQYIVDGNGHVVTSSHSAPAIHPVRKDTTVVTEEYYMLTMDDLDETTTYNYTIKGNNAQGSYVYYDEGSFATLDPKGLFDPLADDPNKTRKIIHNGQICILRGDKIYTLQGTEVK